MTSNQNVGHGHVFPRPDGMKARCGGPSMCSECAKDLAAKKAQGDVWKAEAHNLLEEAHRELDHARVFIRTREKMHPEGVRQFDEVWSKVRRFLERHS